MPYGSLLEVEDASVYIPAEAKAVGAMVLVAERGPIGQAKLVSSFPEFERLYGAPVDGYVGWWCAKRALEAGCALHVSRAVHVATPADLTTRASAAAEVEVPDRAPTAGPGEAVGSATFPVRLSPGQTLIASVSGGGAQTATFNAAGKRLLGVSGTLAAVTAGHQLVLLVGGVLRAVAFAGTENTAALHAAAINAIAGVFVDTAGGQVRITTDHKGSASSLSVDASTDADVLAALGLTSGQVGTQVGVSNVADIEAVTEAEYEAIVEAAVTGVVADEDATHHPRLRTTATGGSASIAVTGGTARTAFGFDTATHSGSASIAVGTLRLYGSSDGTWAHAVRAVIDNDPRDPDTRFRLRVTDASGRLLEGQEFGGLSMDPEDDAYVVTALAEGECLLQAEDLGSDATAPDNRPLAGTYTPAGGNDGLSGLVDADYVGDATARSGVHAFDPVLSGFRLVATPGMTDHDAQQSLTAWAAARKDCRYVGSIPLSVTTAQGAAAFRRRTSPFASGTPTDASAMALYCGWHEVKPTARAAFWVPIDGEVFAAMAAGAAGDGVWSAPAGPKRARLATGVGGIRRPRVVLSESEMRALQEAGVNAVFLDPQAGWVIEGQKTLQLAASSLDRLNVCLLTDFVGERLIWGLRSERYEPNDPVLWRELRNRAERFGEALAGKRGTFRSFRVVCDDTINTAPVIAAKRTRLHFFFVPVETSEEQVVRLVVTAEGVDLDDA